MVVRTKNTALVCKAMVQYAEKITGFYPADWLANDKNIALASDEGDVSLFEWQEELPGSVCGHFFFFCRGKAAKQLALQMIDEVFTNYPEVNRIVGLTPMDNKPALWMTRQLGFTDCGVVDELADPHRLSQLTRDDWDKE
jgi:hypothetical protein